MARIMQRITPFLWFNHQAEQAARFYTGIFDNARITHVSRYDKASAEASGRPAGSAMVVAFELDGQDFLALNGGPQFPLTEAVSFVVNCESQQEIDRYWAALSAGGDEAAQRCGWLKDRYGLSWQVVPTELPRLLDDPDPQRASRVMSGLLQMKKIDIGQLRNA